MKLVPFRPGGRRRDLDHMSIAGRLSKRRGVDEPGLAHGIYPPIDGGACAVYSSTRLGAMAGGKRALALADILKQPSP
jgi:hypothetical protein